MQLICRRKPELSNSVFYFCWQVCKSCFFLWKIANGTNWHQLARKRGLGRIQAFNFSLSCSCRSLQFQKLTIREIYLNITISVSLELERAFIIKGILEWRKEVGTIILIRKTMLIIQIYRKRNHTEVKNWFKINQNSINSLEFPSNNRPLSNHFHVRQHRCWWKLVWRILLSTLNLFDPLKRWLVAFCSSLALPAQLDSLSRDPFDWQLLLVKPTLLSQSLTEWSVVVALPMGCPFAFPLLL